MEQHPSDIYLSKQFKVARLSGILNYHEDAELWKKIISTIIFYSSLGIKILTLFTLIAHISLEWEKIKDPVQTIIILTAHINTIIDLLYIPVKKKQFKHLIDFIDSHFIVPNKDSQDIFHKTFEKYRKTASFTGNLFIASAFFTSMFYYITPLFAEKIDGKRPLPFDTTFPIDVSSGINYWFAYFLLATSMLTMGINGTIICDFNASLIIQTTCQFRFLQHKIMNMKNEIMKTKTDKSIKNKFAMKLSSSDIALDDIDENTNKVQVEEMKNKAMIQKLNECIKYHQALLEFATDLNTQIGPFMLVQMMIYLSFICTSIFTISTISLISSQFIQMASFLACVVFLLFLFCWNANELKIESMEVAEAAYNCDWVDAPRPFKTSLGIIMMRAQKPVQITVWKFGNVDLDMFLMVMKTGYSFYQVLHKMYA